MTPSRLPQLDALRGLALLGIVVVNYQVFALPYLGSGLADPHFDRPVDRAVQMLIALLFETKFYLLFSFLFGYSFTLQLDAAHRAGAEPGARLRRRLMGLMLLGLAHALLLYQGDILLAYGLIGLLLLRWRHWAPRRALFTALGLIAAGAGFWLAVGLLTVDEPWSAEALLTQQAEIVAAVAAYRGSVAQVIAQHWDDLTSEVWIMVFGVQGPHVLAMFLAGMALGKRQALAAAPSAVLRGLAWLALPVGLAGSALYALSTEPPWSPAWSLAGLGLGLFTAPLQTLGYGALFLLACRRWPAVQACFAPAGRMALSNYLLQSLAGAWLFTAWGLGGMGEVSPAATLGLAAAVFAIQLPLSAWWLRGHAYGPVEWGLRALTLWRRPPWRAAA
ncbi:DUF418 domain-containing protein [Bordetella hinzii]|uniref:DUF418 domain-containing protein n=1 Tax=Bordetella hinzii TaxID=103855 RepID=UPI000459DCA2|nr:DUF418 domain-containing protein [Bordetella hinzii]KCB41543.1 PF04235 family protein [Bordetella hinzii 4161]KCB52223.1 PF04235 family protein [Bordetella hinzii 1277]KXA72994.1 hypothetical protein AXA74_10430 [Bordetella hinzii LMG 13501]VEH25114.1 Predicted membrane protein [Bordetella hinzii]